ncbi:kinesin motor domain-containing protein [Biscogniauxia sp. FL1348]|nr:kinesin motor domain-containing protein [Biscogniauxia sp. FL1348]
MAPAGGGNIKVVVRCRPFNGREIERGSKCIVEMKDNQTILTPPSDAAHGAKGSKDNSVKTFAFDRSYWSFDKNAPNYAAQEHLHNDLGKPLLDNAFQGYNNCIFAYGQTGSGKSYSMMGYGKDAGIIPMICQDMFGRINNLQQDKHTRCTVEVSYLEIYNERVRDLLNPATKGNLKVREHPSTGPYVEDLAKLVVGSFQEIENLMDEGNKARTVAATNMNETSSRSHAVFTLILTQKSYDVDTKMEMEKQAKISLVDLAGSERATSTGATGARLKEGAEINRSLSTLGRVIAALADLSTGKKKKGPGGTVPYRDSVLTWLLKDSLGGNSMTAMIAAISPADINYDETLSTLRYADSAKRIKNHAVINEDANARMIRELKEELQLLRSKLGGGVAGSPGGAAIPPEEVYAEGTPLEKQIVSITSADGTVKKVSKAEIAEQLSQSEKLLTDLNQTWEEKLQKTEEIHKEREAALEELGISIEKGFVGLHTPKKMPHLVNLSDDPLLAECLVYNLKPGKTTVGNVDSNAEHQANIRLNGTRILHDHCSFDNGADGIVTITPNENASIMVNGKRISETTRLHSGFRVILGDFHIFRFNHPMEAKAERDENRQSLLRQSITASQLSSLDLSVSSPRLGHDRSFSKAGSEISGSRPDSPAPFRIDSDWSFARREAAGAILGTDKNLQSLTDEELNALFEDVQRARAERVNDREGDEDLESNTSYPFREKYMSTGTIDNLSLDTALTMPSTPKAGEADDRLKEIRETMQSQLEKQKEEYQGQLKSAGAANVEVEEIKREKARMEETLVQLKADMQKQLEVQKKEFEAKINKLDPLKRPKAKPKLSHEEIQQAKKVVQHWKGRHYVQMAEAVLHHAATLKEAQIMSEELGENVVFQFTVIDQGHALCSSYDMVLNDVPSEGDDVALDHAPKPCVGVRVVDYKHTVIHLWSLDKLHDRVRQMRQMHQYLDQPEYCQHFKLDNPFVETCMPEYSLVGEVDVPLKAVFDSRVQDFTLDVLSPHTSHAIGIIKVSLEPSSARAPTSTLKYNVVMHDMVGFAEREGTDVHAQLFIPGISEDGVTTTQMIKDFDEGPIRFDSVHSMSVPLFGPQDVNLRIAIFAKVSTMHLDKLLSWDEMRDSTPRFETRPQGARINETQFFTSEKHDLLARIQILELNEHGEYVPVEVTQTSELDTGAFQLHQGLQRRIALNLTHSSGDALPWEDVSSFRVGKIQLVDHAGKVPDMASPTPDISLRLGAKPVFRQNANGTRSVTVTGQWDSSLHNSLLLDRTTADKYKVQMTLSWEVTSDNLAEPMRFSTNIYCQILGRTYVRQTSMLSSLWQHIRIVHSSTAIFTLGMKPAPIKHVGDLWRMNSQHDYVKGEENLTNWSPRGVSLIGDFIAAKKKRRRIAEIGAAQLFLKKIGLPEPKNMPADDGEPSEDDLAKTSDGDDDSINALLNDTPETSRPSTPKPEEPTEEQDATTTSAEEEHISATAESVETAEPKSEPRSETASGPGSESGSKAESEPQPAEKLQVSEFDEQETAILNKCIDLWQRHPDPVFRILSPANTTPPSNGIAPESAEPPRLIATVIRVPKNPTVVKGGYLLVPNNDSTKWVKRFVELRRPYLHIHNVTDGDEIAIVSLRNSRVDSQPEILALFSGHDEGPDGEFGTNGNGNFAPGHHRTSSGRIVSSIRTGNASSPGPGLGGLNERLQSGVFAIYGTDNTWLFAARNEREKLDWIFRIDQSYFSGGGGSGSGSGTASPLPRGYTYGS